MAKSWKTRTGSSVERMVTALVRRMRLVAAAIAAMTTAGEAIGKIETMMLADAEHVEAGLIGELGGGEHFGIALGGGNRAAGRRIGRDVAEGVDANFHRFGPRFTQSSGPPA